MSKMIKLWTSAQVNGLLRHPHEGVLHLEDDEANRLIEDAAGEDVTSDFSAAQLKDVPVESVTVQSGQSPARPPAFDPRAEESAIIAERQAAATPEPAPTADALDHDGDGRKGGSKPGGNKSKN
jgi:hypothetical protein